MAKFKATIRGLTLTTVPFPIELMRTVAENVLAKIRRRISMGVDVYDMPAKPLSKSYHKFKSKRYPPAIRNLRLTGALLGHLKMKSAQPNRAVIGFLPGIHHGYSTKPGGLVRVKRSLTISALVRINQARSRQWGLSPSDKVVLKYAFRGVQFIKAVKVA